MKVEDWTDLLPHDGVLTRLAECRNTKADLKKLVKARWIWRKEKNPEIEPDEVVIEMLEWVGDWNGQWMLTDNLTDEEMNKLYAVCK